MIETTWMVAWWWVPIAAVGGGIVGLMVFGMMDAGKRADEAADRARDWL